MLPSKSNVPYVSQAIWSKYLKFCFKTMKMTNFEMIDMNETRSANEKTSHATGVVVTEETLHTPAADRTSTAH